jgi:hypothetical protein
MLECSSSKDHCKKDDNIREEFMDKNWRTAHDAFDDLYYAIRNGGMELEEQKNYSI